MRQEDVGKGMAGPEAADARFDLPPQFGSAGDRRMAQRAEAAWRAALPVQAAMPGYRTLATAAQSPFADHAVLLDIRRGDRVDVCFAGSAVAAAFGLGPGYLTAEREDGLAALLLDSCELMRLWSAVVPVDAAIAGSTSALLLTRGVLLPLAADDGALGFVHGVFNWKQLLDRMAHENLRREIDAALRGAGVRGISIES